MVWIEIRCGYTELRLRESPPSRWCGLKYNNNSYKCLRGVTTFAVVWIEIIILYHLRYRYVVTTFAVVWIEMKVYRILSPLSLVTTFAVVWIEINLIGYDSWSAV